MSWVEFVPIILLGAILPLWWMRRLWQQDRLISQRTFISGVVAHGTACLGLGLLYSAHTLALYCGLLLCLIALQPSALTAIGGAYAHAHGGSRDCQNAAAAQKNPQHGAMHLALGDAYHDYREYDNAIAEYELAAKFDPGLQRAVKGKMRNARQNKANFQQTWRLHALAELPDEQQR